MVDKGIKNVVIKKEFLGKVTSSNSRVVRFRVLSEDKNRKSAYSKIFISGSDVVVTGPGDINQVGNTILVNWTTRQTSTLITYDIFVGFDGAVPTYLDSTGSNSYSFLKNGTQSVRVVVQISSTSPELADVFDEDDVRTNILEVYSQTKDLV
jgi:hypothetical protein